MTFVSAFLTLMISTDFEGGSLGKVEHISSSSLRVAVKGEVDQDGRNRQANWYSFRVDGATPGQKIDIDVVNLPGEYNYQPTRGAITADTPPVISYDQVHWTHVLDYEYDAAEPKLRLHIRPRSATFWVAHCPPYTSANLQALRTQILTNPDFHEEVIGKTAGGRDLLLWTVGSNDAKDLPVVWLMFRQHSWESGSSWTGEGAVRYLLGSTSSSRQLRKRAIWKIFPLGDPDGVARGGVRFNVNGFDLNRNWDIEDSERMPEISAQRAAVRKWIADGRRVDLFLSLHNTETAEYLQGPPLAKNNQEVVSLAERFFANLKSMTSFYPSRELTFATETTTPGKPGRMTVIQGLFADFKIPGFLMEQRVSKHPKLGHFPGIRERLKFGSELVVSISATVGMSK
jgi:hypothetical protein